MIKVDVSAFKASLDKYRLETRAKMKDTVWQVMAVWTDQVISLTPYGNSTTHSAAYVQRKETYGWRAQEGLLLGNWDFALNNPDLRFEWASFSDKSGSMLHAKAFAQENRFELGDTIYLSNSTPYLMQDGINGGKSIESGYSPQAPNGLKDPLLQAIMSLHRVAFSKMN